MAFLDSTNEALAVMQIQRILRDLELLENEYSAVPVSGVYENETREAVRDFQLRYGLEPSGTVDYQTWSVMHLIHHDTRHERQGVRRVQLIPRGQEFLILPGQVDDIVYVIQYMLSIISVNYDDFGELEFTGIYDKPTENAIKSFQRKNLLDASGIINASTLEAIFDEYESIILERN